MLHSSQQAKFKYSATLSLFVDYSVIHSIISVPLVIYEQRWRSKGGGSLWMTCPFEPVLVFKNFYHEGAPGKTS